jgi:hypothetical protein
MLTVIYGECHCADCRYDKCRGAGKKQLTLGKTAFIRKCFNAQFQYDAHH